MNDACIVYFCIAGAAAAAAGARVGEGICSPHQYTDHEVSTTRNFCLPYCSFAMDGYFILYTVHTIMQLQLSCV